MGISADISCSTLPLSTRQSLFQDDQSPRSYLVSLTAVSVRWLFGLVTWSGIVSWTRLGVTQPRAPSSTPLRPPSAASSQAEERVEPKPCPSPWTDQTPDWDRWSCHCKYNDADVPLLKTLPTKGDSAWLEAERMEFSSLRPSTSWSAYPGCNPRCVNLWMHSPVRLRLITWSFKNSITQHPPRLSEVSFLQLAWIITLFDLPGELFVWFSP